MILRTFEIDTEEHARMLDDYVSKLNFVKAVNSNKKITPHEMAFGIGRPLTTDEWEQYFTDYPNTDKSYSVEQAKRSLNDKLMNSNDH